MSDNYEFERGYWGDCCNTFDEEQKHYVYASLMEIKNQGYSFLSNNKRIIDIGGGPVSMLLKCIDLKEGLVVDPIKYPDWTISRYSSKNIRVIQNLGENLNETGWDEVWIYNCLQHVENPGKIISNAKKAAPILRIFEWINIPPHEGHPHELTENTLNGWIGNTGFISNLSSNGCYGTAYYGVFEHGI